MKLEISEIIDMRMDAEMRERIFDHMKRELFLKIADEIPFPSGKYALTLQTFDAPFDGFGRRVFICAEVKKESTTRDDVIRLLNLGFEKEVIR